MKRAIACLLAVVLCVPAISAIPAAAASPAVAASAVTLMEPESGTIIYEQNSHERLYPASVTKIMTLLLVIEAVEDGRIALSDMVTGSRYAAGMGGSQIWLTEGERMSVDEMIKCVSVVSANDCSVALAEHIYGSEAAFVERMNMRAQELGMSGSTFANCTGLDDRLGSDEHQTTAHDVALMSAELLKHELIKKYSSIWMDTIRDGKFGLSNTNRLVRFYSGCTGLKTGYTRRAGHCVSATALRDGMELISVVMNASTSQDRFDTARNLLDFGYANYALVEALPDQPLAEVRVVLGGSDTARPVLEKKKILIDKSLVSSLSRSVEMEETVYAPVEKGQKLGELVISSDKGEISRISILAAEDISRMNWPQVVSKMLKTLFMRN